MRDSSIPVINVNLRIGTRGLESYPRVLVLERVEATTRKDCNVVLGYARGFSLSGLLSGQVLTDVLPFSDILIVLGKTHDSSASMVYYYAGNVNEHPSECSYSDV